MSAKGVTGMLGMQSEKKPKIINEDQSAQLEAQNAAEAARRLRAQEAARAGSAATSVVGANSQADFNKMQVGKKTLLGG